MRVIVDSAKCQGHGLCAVISERLFPIDDAGFSAVNDWTDVAANDEKAVRQGQVSCPESAIEVEV